MAKKSKYSVIVEVRLEYIVDAKNEAEAEDMIQDVELPKEYVENSFDFIKVGKIDKNGEPDYGDMYGR